MKSFSESYRQAGVDITAGYKAVELMKKHVARTTIPGVLSGLGGCLLSMGGVTMFAQNMTAGRGFIAMAAATLGAANPLGVVVSSAFFGFAQSMANMLQNSSISSQLTMALPYFATVVALAIFNYVKIRNKRRQLSA